MIPHHFRTYYFRFQRCSEEKLEGFTLSRGEATPGELQDRVKYVQVPTHETAASFRAYVRVCVRIPVCAKENKPKRPNDSSPRLNIF